MSTTARTTLQTALAHLCSWKSVFSLHRGVVVLCQFWLCPHTQQVAPCSVDSSWSTAYTLSCMSQLYQELLCWCFHPDQMLSTLSRVLQLLSLQSSVRLSGTPFLRDLPYQPLSTPVCTQHLCQDFRCLVDQPRSAPVCLPQHCQEVLCCLAYHFRCLVHPVVPATTASWYNVALSLLALHLSRPLHLLGFDSFGGGTLRLLPEERFFRKILGDTRYSSAWQRSLTDCRGSLATLLLTRTHRPYPVHLRRPHFDSHNFPFSQGKPNKKSKKGGAKGSVDFLKESTQLGCVSQYFYPRKSFLREPGMSGSKHTVKFSKAPGTKSKLGKETHEETLIQERCARKAVRDLAKKHLQAQEFGQSYVLCSKGGQR